MEQSTEYPGMDVVFFHRFAISLVDAQQITGPHNRANESGAFTGDTMEIKKEAKSHPKLHLNRTTLRVLSPQALKETAGGDRPVPTVECFPSEGCLTFVMC